MGQGSVSVEGREDEKGAAVSAEKKGRETETEGWREVKGKFVLRETRRRKSYGEC